jgi:hypothetical protein
MWYKIAFENNTQIESNLSLIEQSEKLGVIPEKFYPEIQKTLKELNIRPNPTFTTIEEQLESTRHDTVDNVPNNMLQAEKGRGSMYLFNGNGAPQYASGKGDPSLFMDNLPSTMTLV